MSTAQYSSFTQFPIFQIEATPIELICPIYHLSIIKLSQSVQMQNVYYSLLIKEASH